MFVHILKMVMSLISGYLFIKWCPVIELLSVSDIIVKLVLNPVKFFASSVAFMTGFLINADLIKKEIGLLIDLFQGRLSVELLVIPLHLMCFYLLSTIGIWQTLIFLCLALIYGMISVDFSGGNRRTTW
ncbi:hypothetical protein [Bacillus sp. AK031]